MNHIMVLQAVVVFLGLGHVVSMVVYRLRGKRFDQALIAQAARLNALSEQTFLEGTRLVAEECAALKIEVERAREVAGTERATRERYFNQISEFERQRTQWQTSYYEQSVGHGNAQDLMMGTIEALARQLQALGQRPKIPSVLHALRSEYQATHEMPARAAMEAIEAAKAAAAPQPSATETQPVVP